MEKTIEIPEGYEARIEGNKIILEPKESDDERIIKDIITALSIGVTCDESALYPEATTTLKEAIAYLERQKEQKPVSGNSEKPNNHAEWSEDDKRKINRIYEILGHAADDKGFLASKRIIGDKEAIELQDFLKALRPQPNWKPSEEQMKVLNKVINGEVLLTTQHKCLESLYTDIKKL